MNPYPLLHQLIDQLEHFQRAHQGARAVSDFAHWLLREEAASSETTENRRTPEQAFQFVRMNTLFYRTARQYARKALEGTPLRSEDEYAYLDLLKNGPLPKTALIHLNRHEKPTGMDIIRRLVASGLARQSDNPDDGRSQLIHITESGSALVQQLAPRMQFVAELSTGNATEGDMTRSIAFLDELEQFHQLVLAKTKGNGLVDLVHTAKALFAR
jgi:DNA-binding MarR family transcriptional regulator